MANESWKSRLGVWLLVALPVLCIGWDQMNRADRTDGGDRMAGEVERERLNGLHCLSLWDGGHPGMERAIKGRLRDPRSMEVIRTRITPVINPDYPTRNGWGHRVVVDFRARNGFGGMNVAVASGLIAHEGCAVVGIVEIH